MPTMNVNITIPNIKGVSVTPAVCKDDKFFHLDSNTELISDGLGYPVVVGQYVFFFYGRENLVKKAQTIFIKSIQKQMK